MIEKECEICGKKIEGYSEKHVSYLMEQHNLTHKMKGGVKNVYGKKENQ